MAEKSQVRAQVWAAVLVVVELGLMETVSLVVVPRMSAAVGQLEHPSPFTRMVFSGSWMHDWMLAALVLGTAAVFGARGPRSRAALLTLCLLAGLLPILANTAGVYTATFDAAAGP